MRRERSVTPTQPRDLDAAEILLEQAGQPLHGDDDEELTEPAIKNEVCLYLGMDKKLRPRYLNVLQWWKVYQDRLPLLASLACQKSLHPCNLSTIRETFFHSWQQHDIFQVIF
jgi:hypothetical protein